MLCWLRHWCNLSWGPPQYWLDYIVSIMSLISLLYSSPCWILVCTKFCYISVFLSSSASIRNLIHWVLKKISVYIIHFTDSLILFQFSLFFSSVIFHYYFDSFLNVFIHLKIFMLYFISHLCTIFLMLLGLYSFWLLDP